MSEAERLRTFRGKACRVANRADELHGGDWPNSPARVLEALREFSRADDADLPASYQPIVEALKTIYRITANRLANGSSPRGAEQDLRDAAWRICETVREIVANEGDERLKALGWAEDSPHAAALAPAPAEPPPGERPPPPAPARQPSGTPTPDAPDPEYQLRLVGEVWHLRYTGEEGDYPAKGNQCLAWLAKLLAAPNRFLTVADLRGDPEGKLAADAMLRGVKESDRQKITEIRKRLQEIDDITEETGGREALDNEKANLLDQLKGPLGKQLDSQLKKDHANIATQLRKLMKKLAKAMPQMAAHLKAFLKLDLPNFGYYPPDPSPDWKI